MKKTPQRQMPPPGGSGAASRSKTTAGELQALPHKGRPSPKQACSRLALNLMNERQLLAKEPAESPRRKPSLPKLGGWS